MRFIKFAAVVSVFLALLNACGGGGGGGSISPAPSWIGTKQLGVAGHNTVAYSVATDASGNVYVAGYTNGGLDGNTLTGISDFFVTKYNSKGVKQFTRQLGVAGADTGALSVATDTAGNVYVAGYTNGGLNGGSATGTYDFFVTKYDSNFTYQSTKQLGVAGADTEAYSVATDASGNVYVAGYTSGGLNGGSATGTYDFFVTKYNSNFTYQSTKQLGVAAADTEAYSVATDAAGNVYVAGYTTGGLGGNSLSGTSSYDFFVTKYDSNFTYQSTKQLGVAGRTTVAWSVAADTAGNVYVSGYTNGGLNGGLATGSFDFFVTKYDSNFAYQSTKQLGVAGADTEALSVATDAAGNVYVAGYTNGGLNGGSATGAYDFFVAKYDRNFTNQSTKQMGVAGAETWANSVATDAAGNVYVAGFTNGGLDGNTLTGSADFFVIKYNSSGVKQ